LCVGRSNFRTRIVNGFRFRGGSFNHFERDRSVLGLRKFCSRPGCRGAFGFGILLGHRVQESLNLFWIHRRVAVNDFKPGLSRNLRLIQLFRFVRIPFRHD
jgi:hypothetical protein